MNTLVKIFYFISISTLVVSCKPKVQKIEYGTDVCHYCKMTIVEKTHAAEVVTKKGRAQKYDAIECMLNEMKEEGSDKIALFLVTDYTKPTVLVDATKATFLISKEIKSPMGANLSAFSNKKDGEKYTGNIYDWEGIKKVYKVIK